MSDLISRQAAIKAFCEYECGVGNIKGKCGADSCGTIFDNIPPADVVEIIRCKDCRWGREVCGNIECFADINAPIEYHGYEWLCPNGKRRTDERHD